MRDLDGGDVDYGDGRERYGYLTKDEVITLFRRMGEDDGRCAAHLVNRIRGIAPHIREEVLALLAHPHLDVVYREPVTPIEGVPQPCRLGPIEPQLAGYMRRCFLCGYGYYYETEALADTTTPNPECPGGGEYERLQREADERYRRQRH